MHKTAKISPASMRFSPSAMIFKNVLRFANPVKPPNPAKAPWYFLGLQEMVGPAVLVDDGGATLSIFDRPPAAPWC
jgi:hypothetical protein